MQSYKLLSNNQLNFQQFFSDEVRSDSGDYLEVLADSTDQGHVYCVCSIKNRGGEFALKNEGRVMSLSEAFEQIPGFALICE